MFEIIGMAVAVSGIAALARGRGASPVFSGTIAALGWAAIRFGGLFLIPPGDGVLLLMLGSWAWLAAVALYLRFVVGARMAKPDGKWSCSNCSYLNNSSSVICEACQQPYQVTKSALEA